MVEAGWWLREADTVPKGATHSPITSFGVAGAFIMRDLSSTGSHSSTNRHEEGGMGTSHFLTFDCL